MKVFAIELTNWCNAKCGFCPYTSPDHNRPKGWMTEDTLRLLINKMEPPREINLSGLGEPTLHRELVRFVSILRANGVAVQMNTNGQQLDQDLYDQLWEAGLNKIILTSDYFPWDKGKLKVKEGLPVTFFTISREPDHPELGQTQKPLDDWAGQVGSAPRDKVRCSFLHDDFVQVCWDGTVQRCCCDFNANHALGNMHDESFHDNYQAGVYVDREIPLCGGCAGYVFESGLVAGDYAGAGDTAPDAFTDLVQLEKPDAADHPET